MAIVVYGIPLVITGDPLWPLPAATDPDTIAVHWEGRRTEVRRGDPRHDGLRRAINEALSSIDGIEYRYGLPPEDFARLRANVRAVEASYARPAQAHGSYAIGQFTRLFVSFEGDEYARGLIFVGQESGYRAGPLRSRKLPELREIAERVAAER